MLKGNLSRPIRNESRAGLTAPEATRVLCLDFDGLDPKERSVEELLVEIGIGRVDYIIQYSASQGIKPGLNAHVFILLDKAVSSEQLKTFFKWRNLNTPFLREQVTLTKTGMSLKWPLDITVADNSKLLYIAPPNIVGFEDPVPERIILFNKVGKNATILPQAAGVDQQVTELIIQLRKLAGLKEHKLNTKFFRSEQVEVLANPDVAAITGVKRHGDFTYLNLNGGHNWSYFFTTSKPEVVYNFKGEPPYLLRELAPDYYKDAKMFAKTLKIDAHRPVELKHDIKHWAINNKTEGKYYKVTYKPGQGVTLDPAPTLKHLEDWCVINKVPVPDVVEDWHVVFDPTTNDIIDKDSKTINLYSPTAYKAYKEAYDAPKEYFKLIKHVCGGDDEATSRFLNWLAFIWQTGKRPKTAWLFHGTYGTGKGRLLLILKHLFGKHCIGIGPEAMEDKFNEHLQQAQIVWLDELTTDSWDSNKMTPKLRALIDGEVGIRQMRKAWANTDLFFGLIIAANEFNPVEIRFGDRRFNVAPRQETPLSEVVWDGYKDYEVLDEELGLLYDSENLSAFASYLWNYQVDVSAVRVPLANDAKNQVMQVTQNLPEDIVQALTSGDASFFLSYMPAHSNIPNLDAAEYRGVLEHIMRGGKVALSTKEIAKLFEFIAGWKQAVGKFTKAVARSGLKLAGKTARRGHETFAGAYFEFTVTEADKVLWAQVCDKGLQVVRESRVNE